MKWNHVYNEDCVLTMNRLVDNFIDLTVTSPPYGNLRKYKGFVWDFETIVQMLYDKTKPGGVVVWVVGDQTIDGSESGESFYQAIYFKTVGFNLHDTMIYGKQTYLVQNHNRYDQMFEYMFVFSKGKPKTFNPIRIPTVTPGSKKYLGNGKAEENTYGMRKRNETSITKQDKLHGNIFYYSGGGNDKTIHNAPFPEELARDHILTWSNKGDLVYDPFMGSGTTAKMAKEHGRKYLGSEISTEYCKVIEERLSQGVLGL